MPKHGKQDPLQVQVALRIKAPPGTKIAPRVLQQIIDKMVNGEELPKSVEVRGIFWRNPNRKGNLSHWRYHSGADLSVAPTNAPLEGSKDPVTGEFIPSPRGSLSDAIGTLGGALYSGVITF